MKELLSLNFMKEDVGLLHCCFANWDRLVFKIYHKIQKSINQKISKSPLLRRKQALGIEMDSPQFRTLYY